MLQIGGMDHGGDIDRAIATYGGDSATWLDLSTGINRQAYPVTQLSTHAWAALPTKKDMQRLRDVARRYYAAAGSVVVLAGAQQAIQLLPHLRKPGRMAMISPSYNEYSNVFSNAGWQVQHGAQLSDLVGADIAVVVNPNNPDGRLWSKADLLDLRQKVGLLVVDESFMDMTPEHSLAAYSDLDGLLILKSFGKFFGLAGVRLGFVFGGDPLVSKLAQISGPWPVCGAAIGIACQALQDDGWIQASRANLSICAKKLDCFLGWTLVGGTDLFRLYQVEDAQTTQAGLAKHGIWTRQFPWSKTMLRVGTPGVADFARLAQVLPLKLASI